MSVAPPADSGGTDRDARAAGADAGHEARKGAGVLYLLPTPLGDGDDPLRVLPAATVESVTHVDYVIAEHARSARAVLSRLPMRVPLQAIEVRELNRHTTAQALPELLAPLLAGRDAALVSEAGCPAIADPGAAVVALAHARGLRVVPLIGPSSIVLALMASGMNGQRFAFAGYVPVAADERAARLRELERRSARDQETQLLIETPYRNQALFDALIAALSPDTMLSIATDLTLAGEAIGTRSVAAWRARPTLLPKAPTVFSLLAARAAGAAGPREPARRHRVADASRGAPPPRGRGGSRR